MQLPTGSGLDDNHLSRSIILDISDDICRPTGPVSTVAHDTRNMTGKAAENHPIFTDEDYTALNVATHQAPTPMSSLIADNLHATAAAVPAASTAPKARLHASSSAAAAPASVLKRPCDVDANIAVAPSSKKARSSATDQALGGDDLRKLLASFGEQEQRPQQTSPMSASRIKSILANFGDDDRLTTAHAATTSSSLPAAAATTSLSLPAAAAKELPRQRLWGPGSATAAALATPVENTADRGQSVRQCGEADEADEFLMMLDTADSKRGDVLPHGTAAAAGLAPVGPASRSLPPGAAVGHGTPAAAAGLTSCATDEQDRFDYLMQLADGAEMPASDGGSLPAPVVKPDAVQFIEDIDLTDEQLELIDLVNQGHNVFGTGMAGTGKSHVIKALSQRLDKANVVYALTATTGRAGSLIGGTTLESWMGLGRCEESIAAMIRTVLRKPELKDRWLTTKKLVIDEVSMLQSRKLAILHRVGQHVRNRFDLVCGGLQLVLFGDFGQLEAVKTDQDLERGKNSVQRFDGAVGLRLPVRLPAPAVG
jgi:hypothetical protein